MNARVDVSVIVVNWNTRELLGECLASVFGETKGISFEVIVVDNSSSDGSVEMVESEFPKAVLIANTENLGFAAANNQGIERSAGRYVLLLNSDTVVLRGAIQKTVTFADGHAEAAVVGCRVLNPDGSLQLTCFMFPSLLNVVLSATYLYKAFPGSRFFGRELMTWWDRGDIREVDVVTGCFMLVRRAAVDEVGLMDERYFMYAEETDWCYRFAGAGWKVLFFPGAETVHYLGQSSVRSERDMKLQRRVSMLRYFRKHDGRGVACAANLLFALRDAARVAVWSVAWVWHGLLGSDRKPWATRIASGLKTLRFHLSRAERVLLRVAKLIVSLLYFVLAVAPMSVFSRLTRRGCGSALILCYHGVRRDQREAFAWQMEVVLKAGRPLAVGETGSLDNGRRGISVTFDDGFADLIENALPELERRGIPATVFVPFGNLGRRPVWRMDEMAAYASERVMTADEVRAVATTELVTIGSHTRSHTPLTRLDDSSLDYELGSSKADLERVTGRGVELVAFPYGAYDERVLAHARRAGYRRAFSLEQASRPVGGSGFLLGRVGVDPDDEPLEFWLKLHEAYQWMALVDKARWGRRRRAAEAEAHP